ncbi:MAG: aminodeoxychorismate synthase component I [Pirellulales bacterium]|nr:aminodeoxychorismate synthase component I [Pirellulales bacterium]
MPPHPNEPQIVELPPLKLPFWRYFEIFRDRPYAFLLDSAMESARQGRYSFLGGDPFLVFKAKRRKTKMSVPKAECTIIDFWNVYGNKRDKPKVTKKRQNPFEILRELFAAYRLEPAAYAGHPAPFFGGAVGYFGYEAGHFFENLPDRTKDDLGLPDIHLMFFNRVLAHCHETGKTFLSYRGLGGSEQRAAFGALAQHLKTLAKIKSVEESAVAKPTRTHSDPSTGSAPEVLTHFDESSYGGLVQTVKDHIAAGDVYQVCLTHRLEAPLAGGTAWDLYRELRRINPAPFASFLRFPEVEVVSSSPERFLKLDLSGLAESRPIKGTRPRGKTPAEDERLRSDLQNSPKDRAENVMIVDLVRNDFGRVCSYGSVKVRDFLAIEPYATVFQMVSTVEGRLAEGRDRFDLIRACFPGGSMTGAPKIEAMKIIDRLEPVARGIYSGAIGYLDFAGAMDLSMVIRAILVKDGKCHLHVGGGIVADSDPAAEYRETQDKARALVAAIETLRKMMNAEC